MLYNEKATNPLIQYSSEGVPLTTLVPISIWIKIFLALRGDLRSNAGNVEHAAIDISVLDAIKDMNAKQLQQRFHGVGPNSAKVLEGIIKQHRKGAVAHRLQKSSK